MITVDKPATSSRVHMLLVEEISRLNKALTEAERRAERAELERDEITNDRDRFARKYHEWKALAEYWKREALPRGVG